MSSIEEIVIAVRDCWCEALGDSVAECCLVATRPVIAECCAGFGWVRLIGAYPSKEFPAAYNIPDRCRIDTWAVTIEFGVARCVPGPCDPSQNVCCESELTAAMASWDDFARFRRLFTCCLPGKKYDTGHPIIRQDEIVVGSWSTLDVEAQCQQSVGTATFYVSDSCGC